MAVEFAPPRTETGGLVGDRCLIGVQLFDIGRLRNHYHPIIPVGFVALTGIGPKNDSNNSGKTTFLAAVALANGDLEWRLRGRGPAAAASLLFDPAHMANTRSAATPATHGYIACLYARPDATQVEDADPLTVWTRINAAGPHLRFRVADGVRLCGADGDNERLRQANGIWGSQDWLPLKDDRTELGPEDLNAVLFGGEVRTVASITKRGNLPTSTQSLLSLEQVEPHEVGRTLIELAGLGHLFENELEHRRSYFEMRGELEDQRRKHEEASAAEQSALDEMERFERAARRLERADELWALHYARGLVDAVELEIDRRLQIQGLETELEELATRRRELEAEQEGLTDTEALEEQLERASDEANEAAGAFEDALEALAEARADRRALNEDLGEALELAAEADGTPTDRAEQEREEASRVLEQALGELGAVQEELERARRALAAVREGRGGEPGRIIERLGEAGIGAAVAVDTLRIAEDHRTAWEARLHPWWETVIVDDADIEAALEAISGHPGAMLLAGTATPPDRALPRGVEAADARLTGFLAALAETARSQPAGHVSYEQLGVHVVGGWEHPLTGREAREAAARRRIASAEQEVGGKQDGLDRARRRLEEADRLLKAAKATERAEKLSGQLNELDETISTLSDERDELQATKRDTERRRQELDVLVRTAAVELDRITGEIRQIDGSIERATSERRSLEDEVRHARREYYAERWGGSEEEAREALGERRSSTEALAADARSAITAALTELGIDHEDGSDAPTARVGALVRDRRGEKPLPAKEDVTRDLIDELARWLAPHRRGYEVERARIDHNRGQREKRLDSLASACLESFETLGVERDLLHREVEAAIRRTEREFDRLNRAAGGHGAALRHDSHAPYVPGVDEDYDASGRAQSWTWEVEPAWAGVPGGRPVSYRSMRANTAQDTTQAAHLTLAALLAHGGTSGRLLLLDELGSQLGKQHRADLLEALVDTAEATGTTVLASCQDDLLVHASRVSHQTLEFHLPSDTDELNQPTRVSGYDPEDPRVEMQRRLVTAGRPPL